MLVFSPFVSLCVVFKSCYLSAANAKKYSVCVKFSVSRGAVWVKIFHTQTKPVFCIYYFFYMCDVSDCPEIITFRSKSANRVNPMYRKGTSTIRQLDDNTCVDKSFIFRSVCYPQRLLSVFHSDVCVHGGYRVEIYTGCRREPADVYGRNNTQYVRMSSPE